MVLSEGVEPYTFAGLNRMPLPIGLQEHMQFLLCIRWYYTTGIVILCEAFCLLSHHLGATQPLAQAPRVELGLRESKSLALPLRYARIMPRRQTILFTLFIEGASCSCNRGVKPILLRTFCIELHFPLQIHYTMYLSKLQYSNHLLLNSFCYY